MASLELDEISRSTIARFGVKICMSVLIASVTKSGLVVGTSFWIGLYAACAGLVAALHGQRFPTKSFNHWDEALWLMATSLGLKLVHKVIV